MKPFYYDNFVFPAFPCMCASARILFALFVIGKEIHILLYEEGSHMELMPLHLSMLSFYHFHTRTHT